MRTALVLLALLCGAQAFADEDPTARARLLFDSGRRHFDLAEYEPALADFKEGYRLKDDPVFLYNIALCHRILGRKSEALRFFRNYLSRRPDAPNKDDVDKRIAALDEELASEAKAKAVAAQVPITTEVAAVVVVPPPPPPPTPVYKKWWLWTAVGVVVVGVGVGLGVGLTQSGANGRYVFPRIDF